MNSGRFTSCPKFKGLLRSHKATGILLKRFQISKWFNINAQTHTKIYVIFRCSSIYHDLTLLSVANTFPFNWLLHSVITKSNITLKCANPKKTRSHDNLSVSGQNDRVLKSHITPKQYCNCTVRIVCTSFAL